MKVKDIANALTVLELVRDEKTFKNRLEQLQKAKADADAAFERMTSAAADMDAREKALSTLMADQKQQADSLTQREEHLKDAEQQHQLEINNSWKAFKDREASASEASVHFHEEVDKIEKDQALKAQELTKREKALTKRELDAQKRDEDLTARERALTQAQTEHAQKLARLRELAA